MNTRRGARRAATVALLAAAFATGAGAATQPAVAPAQPADGPTAPAAQSAPAEPGDARIDPRVRSIPWLRWSDYAFARARSGPRPILLDVVSVACSWCDEMSRTTFADPRVIRFVNAHFVPVRVDGEHRPDLFARYSMGAGHTTVLLLPSGEPILLETDGRVERAGGNYYDADAFLALLVRTQELFARHRAALEERAEELAAFEREQWEPAQAAVSRRAIDDARRYMMERFDREQAGFYFAPKRPGYEWLEFALDLYLLDDDEEALAVVLRTLDALVASPVYDRVEGGFHRYAAQRDWEEPLYGKRLDHNAAALRLLADAYAIVRKPTYRTALDTTLLYLHNYLRDADGGFYVGQEADTATAESLGYYALTGAERLATEAPPIREEVFAGSTARAAAAVLRAYVALGEEALLDGALETTGWLLDAFYRRGRGVRHATSTPAGERALYLLADQLAVGELLLDVYELTGDETMLAVALDLGRSTEANFRHGDSGLAGTIPDPTAHGVLSRPVRSVLEQGRAGTLFARLGALSGAGWPQRAAVQTLGSVADDTHEQPNGTGPYARGVLRAVYRPVRFVVAAGDAAPEAERRELLRRLAALPLAWRAVLPLEPGSARWAELGIEPDVAPGAVFMSVRGGPFVPVAAADLESAVEGLRAGVEVEGP